MWKEIWKEILFKTKLKTAYKNIHKLYLDFPFLIQNEVIFSVGFFYVVQLNFAFY